MKLEERKDLLTGELFIPKVHNQLFANKENRKKWYKQQRQIKKNLQQTSNKFTLTESEKKELIEKHKERVFLEEKIATLLLDIYGKDVPYFDNLPEPQKVKISRLIKHYVKKTSWNNNIDIRHWYHQGKLVVLDEDFVNKFYDKKEKQQLRQLISKENIEEKDSTVDELFNNVPDIEIIKKPKLPRQAIIFKVIVYLLMLSLTAYLIYELQTI